MQNKNVISLEITKTLCMLPIKYDCTIIADIKRPDIQGRNFRIPIQILMNIKDRNIAGKGPSTLRRMKEQTRPLTTFNANLSPNANIRRALPWQIQYLPKEFHWFHKAIKENIIWVHLKYKFTLKSYFPFIQHRNSWIFFKKSNIHLIYKIRKKGESEIILSICSANAMS